MKSSVMVFVIFGLLLAAHGEETLPDASTNELQLIEANLRSIMPTNWTLSVVSNETSACTDMKKMKAGFILSGPEVLSRNTRNHHSYRESLHLCVWPSGSKLPDPQPGACSPWAMEILGSNVNHLVLYSTSFHWIPGPSGWLGWKADVRKKLELIDDSQPPSSGDSSTRAAGLGTPKK